MKKQGGGAERLAKVATGFPGFDAMTAGGLPQGRISVVSGGAGTGKTLFAMQTMVNVIRAHDGMGVFVSFEENPAAIARNFDGFGWELGRLIGKKLLVIDGRWQVDALQSGSFDISGLLAAVEGVALKQGASLLVLDAMDALLSMLPEAPDTRRELLRLQAWTERLGLTTLVTTKPPGTSGQRVNATARFEDIAMYMADCVVLLERSAPDAISSRNLFIQKYRGSDHVQNKVPYVIGSSGIEVEPVNPASGGFRVFDERVSSGVLELDEMLCGGYYRGSTTLISGSPGTSKTTLSAKFAEAACQRGERGLYICFDEAPEEIVRNMASVGIKLDGHRRKGLLHMEGFVAHSAGADQLTSKVLALLARLQPGFLVLDPVSAFASAGSVALAHNAVRLIVHQCKLAGISLILTSLIDQHGGKDEISRAQISTLADNWLHLSYVINGGERNRALTIIKSRGTGHSNQVRELVLSDAGIHLEKVYTEQGEVLMGALRWQREERSRREQQQAKARSEQRYRQVMMEKEELTLRIAQMQSEVEQKALTLEAISQESLAAETLDASQRKSIAGMREHGSNKGKGSNK
jgi:circadian clock protein KaiC